jgi:hypothetical protein
VGSSSPNLSYSSWLVCSSKFVFVWELLSTTGVCVRQRVNLSVVTRFSSWYIPDLLSEVASEMPWAGARAPRSNLVDHGSHYGGTACFPFCVFVSSRS